MTDEEIIIAFDLLLQKVKGNAREFIESLHDFWEKKGFLTDKQEAALMKFYERNAK